MLASHRRTILALLCALLAVASAGLAENYAVFFAGGANRDENWEVYYEDILRHYKHVVNRWNYRPENVWVIFADGTNPYADLTMWVAGNENSDWSYVVNNGSEVLEANIPNTQYVLTGLHDLGIGDMFYFWSYDHGYGDKGVSGVHNEEGFSGWNQWENNNINDDVFAGWVNPIGAGRHAYVLGQCYSGGVLEELQMYGLPDGHKRFGCASATHQEPSQSGELSEGFNDAWCDGIENDDLTHTQHLFLYALNDTDWAEGGGADAAYNPPWHHPWMVGDNLFLPVSVWEGSGAGGSSTDWEHSGNWSHHYDSGSLRVEFDEAGQAIVDEPLVGCQYMTLDWDALYVGESAYVRIAPTGFLSCLTADVGKAGTLSEPRYGYIQQGGGDAQFAYELVLGDKQHSTGKYWISGGKLTVNSGGVLVVGDSGAGIFEQSGGEVEIVAGGELHLGREPGGDGTYTLHDGLLKTPATYVGYEGAGTLTHSSPAQHDVTGILHIGYGEGSTGHYTSAGTLRAGTIKVGHSGQGTLNVILGSTEADNIYLGSMPGSQGHVSVLGGAETTVMAVTGNIEVGAPEGLGTFTLGHGGWVIVNGMRVGDWGNGTFTQTGGTVTAQWEVIGDHGGSMQSALYEQTGGTNSVAGKVAIGGDGQVTDPGYPPSGRYVLSGGRLDVGGSLVVGNAGTGQFDHERSEVTVTGGLNLGVSGGSGTYTMGQPQTSDPSLTVSGSAWLGNVGGYGEFQQHRGTHTVGGDMMLGTGSGSEGLYEVHLGAVLDVEGKIRIGSAGEGTGTLRINEGTVVANELVFGTDAALETYGTQGVLRVNAITGWDTQLQAVLNCSLQIGHSGGDGSGSYALPADTYLGIAGDLVAGYDAPGAIQHFGNNVHLWANALHVGYEADSNGTYSMETTTGSLATGGTYVGGFGPGTFTQRGGTHTIQGELVLGNHFASGRYELWVGSLTADTTSVGRHGQGTLVQSGGTCNLVSALYLGGETAAATGTYELRAGQLITPEIHIGNEESGAAGTLEWSSGTISTEAIHVHAGAMNVHKSWTYGGNLYVNGGAVQMGDHDLTHDTTNEMQRLEVRPGGRLEADTLLLGSSNMGFVQQSGGNVDVELLRLGDSDDGYGTYEISGGDLMAGSVDVGSSGYGEFQHDGGTVTTTGVVRLGRYPTGQGMYDLTGTGRLEAWELYVGDEGWGFFSQNSPSSLVKVSNELVIGKGAGGDIASSYQIVNGFLEAKNIHVGENGAGTLTVWSLSGVRAEALTIHDSGALNVLTGRVVAGTLAKEPDGLIYQELHGSRDMGVVGFNSLVGFGANPAFAGNVEIGHAIGGAYAVEYTVATGQQLESDGRLSIGIDAATTFTQTGPSSFVAASGIYVGMSFSGVANYDLQGGFVNTNELSVGYSGRGSMTQTGGEVSITSLGLGSKLGGQGHYELSGDGIIDAEGEVIGHFGYGEFTQNGGSNTASQWLILGFGAYANGIYTMNGGGLSVGTLMVGGIGNGRFYLNGGSVEVTGEAHIGAGDALGELTLDRANLSVSDGIFMQPVYDSLSGRGTLRYVIHGTTPGSDYGQVRNDGAPGEGVFEAAGTLVMDFVNYTPSAGDSFELAADFGEVYGPFGSVTILGLETSGFAYDVNYGDTEVTFTVLTDGVANSSAVASDIGIDPWTFFGGNSQCVGGVDVHSPRHAGEKLRSDYSRRSLGDLGMLPPMAGVFHPAGEEAQVWQINAENGDDGNSTDDIVLTFAYDEAALGAGEDERLLAIWHHDGSDWEELPVLERDLETDHLTVRAASLSPFVLGYVSRLPGDCDEDRDVDSCDYIALKRNIGLESGAKWCDGDLDEDGDVDLDDLLSLRSYYGLSLPPVEMPEGGIPEPATLALLAAGAAGLLRRRRG